MNTELKALILKEIRQIVRDKTAAVLGIVLPLVLIILFGCGMNFDAQDVRIGFASESSDLSSQTVQTKLAATPLFIMRTYPSESEGLRALEVFEIEALVSVRRQGKKHSIAAFIDGIDVVRANAIEQALSGTLGTFASDANGIDVTVRTWYNEANISRLSLVPGLFVLVLTMIGMLLTGFVLAREWERGTMVSLIATPMTPAALLLSKIIPYFMLGSLGWALCLLASTLLYEVPVRGSFTLIVASSALYLLACLLIGLSISGGTKSQFLSAQICLMAGFMPALSLSGFIFDLRCMPAWGNVLAHLLPPLYYLDCLKAGFYGGGTLPGVLSDLAALVVFVTLGTFAAYRVCTKKVRP